MTLPDILNIKFANPPWGSSISGKSPSLAEISPQHLVARTIAALETTNKLAQARGHLRLLYGQQNSQPFSYLLANSQIVLRLKAHIAHRSAPLALEEVTGERPARFLLGLLFEHCRGTQNTFLRLQLQNCGIPGGVLDLTFALRTRGQRVRLRRSNPLHQRD